MSPSCFNLSVHLYLPSLRSHAEKHTHVNACSSASILTIKRSSVFAPCNYIYPLNQTVILRSLTTTDALSQFSSKFFVNCQVDEKIGHAVDVVGEAEVAADWSSDVEHVHDRREGEDEDQEQTKSDLRRLHVGRCFVRIVPAKKIKRFRWFIYH